MYKIEYDIAMNKYAQAEAAYATEWYEHNQGPEYIPPTRFILTDGIEVFPDTERDFTAEELTQAQKQAKFATGGNMWWTIKS